jgi:hypothetical protein
MNNLQQDPNESLLGFLMQLTETDRFEKYLGHYLLRHEYILSLILSFNEA